MTPNGKSEKLNKVINILTKPESKLDARDLTEEDECVKEEYKILQYISYEPISHEVLRGSLPRYPAFQVSFLQTFQIKQHNLFSI